MTVLDHQVTLTIPFETERQAETAQKVISVDPVLKQNEISVTFTAQGTTLLAHFAGVSDRVIRVAISNTIDNLKTIIETMDEFEGKKEAMFEAVEWTGH